MNDKAKRYGAVAALATAIAVPAEGLRQFAYYDPPGILTVCFGHTGADVVKGRKYAMDECEALLNTDMLDAVKAVDKCQPGLPVNVLAAFSDAAYNLGPKIACDTERSTAARLLAAGDIEAACKELARWSYAKVAGVSVKLPGLVKRREAEMKLCLEGGQS